LIDRTGTFGTVVLGMTCARAVPRPQVHPIKQKDFYQILAYFDGSSSRHRRAASSELSLILRPADTIATRRAAEGVDVATLQNEWRQDAAAMDNPGKKLDWLRITVSRFVRARDRIMRKPAAERTEREQHRLTNYFLASQVPSSQNKRKLREAEGSRAQGDVRHRVWIFSMRRLGDHRRRLSSACSVDSLFSFSEVSFVLRRGT